MMGLPQPSISGQVAPVSGPRLPLKLRLACDEDIPVLVDFRVDFMRAVKEIAPEDEAALRAGLSEMFRRGISSGKTIYWLAETEGRPVSSCALLFPRGRGSAVRSWRARRAELMGVYTLPAFRRSGAASALVALALTEARRIGLRELFLQPTEEARSMYLRAGFTPDGDRMILKLCAGGRSSPLRLSDSDS